MRRVVIAEAVRFLAGAAKCVPPPGQSQQSRSNETTTVSYGGVSVTREMRPPIRVGDRGFSAGGEVTTAIGEKSVSTAYEFSS